MAVTEPEAQMDFQSMPKIEKISFFPLFSSYIYHLVDDVESLTFSTKAVVADFAHDGVVYLELRTTPRAMPKAGLDKASYIQAVLDAVAAAEAENPSIRAKLILSMDRRNTPGRGARGRPPGAAGDISLFTPAIREAKTGGGLGVTIHFAEAECSASEAELQTIMDWDPDRLGHVIHVPEHIKRRITTTRPGSSSGTPSARGLELCLSCNVHAKMIVGSFEAHHFGEWWKVEGVTVVPCTDDVGVFGSPVSNEWRLIQQHFRLTRAELLGLARKGIDVIFGGEEEKQRLRSIMW
ncbi:adenosine deaminase [Apiospora hydei]|uniref:Adenosine deaminase n=1 Tax=Apiospora hydei TaxID=1337664 RepID=A0ABR1V3R3_9PEZI